MRIVVSLLFLMSLVLLNACSGEVTELEEYDCKSGELTFNLDEDEDSLGEGSVLLVHPTQARKVNFSTEQDGRLEVLVDDDDVRVVIGLSDGWGKAYKGNTFGTFKDTIEDKPFRGSVYMNVYQPNKYSDEGPLYLNLVSKKRNEVVEARVAIWYVRD